MTTRLQPCPTRPPATWTATRTATLTAALLMALLAACSKPAETPAGTAGASTAVASAPGASGPAAAAAPAAAASAPPVVVTTVRAQVRDLPILITATGTVAPLSSVDIRSQTTSLITQVHVKEGQFVKAGDLLFTLDTRADEANVAKARAQLARDEAALADAQRQLKRSQDLLAQNFISQGALDTNQTNVQSLTAALAADRAAVDAALLGLSYNRIKAPSSGRLGAINVFKGSSVQANQTSLVSLTQLDPIAVQFNLPQRHLADALAALKDGGAAVTAVAPDSAGLPPSPAPGPAGAAPAAAAPGAGRTEKGDGGLKAAAPDAAASAAAGGRALAAAPQPQGSGGAAGDGSTRPLAGDGGAKPGAASEGGARPGAAGPGRTAAAPPPALKGRLKFVDNAVDPSSGTVKVKAVFDNAANKLWPGAFVNVSLTASTIKGAVIVPQAAIVQAARGTLVFAVVDGKAVPRPVQVLYAQGEEAAVSGLKPGERIVLEGRQNVRPGTSVVERAREGGGKGGGSGGAGGAAAAAASGGAAAAQGGAASGGSPAAGSDGTGGTNGRAKGAPAP